MPSLLSALGNPGQVAIVNASILSILFGAGVAVFVLFEREKLKLESELSQIASQANNIRFPYGYSYGGSPAREWSPEEIRSQLMLLRGGRTDDWPEDDVDRLKAFLDAINLLYHESPFPQHQKREGNTVHLGREEPLKFHSIEDIRDWMEDAQATVSISNLILGDLFDDVPNEMMESFEETLQGADDSLKKAAEATLTQYREAVQLVGQIWTELHPKLIEYENRMERLPSRTTASLLVGLLFLILLAGVFYPLAVASPMTEIALFFPFGAYTAGTGWVLYLLLTHG